VKTAIMKNTVEKTDTAQNAVAQMGSEPETWELRLYVAGQSPKSTRAYANLRRLCEEHLAGRYSIEVVDLIENPHLAAGDEIIAIPTLVRKLPAPLRKLVGDLRDTERTLVGLQLRPLE
jgi:circadian clock protein KaiB